MTPDKDCFLKRVTAVSRVTIKQIKKHKTILPFVKYRKKRPNIYGRVKV